MPVNTECDQGSTPSLKAVKVRVLEPVWNQTAQTIRALC